MNPYDRYILPYLIDLACSTRPHAKQRQKVVPQATGRVLEVGMGSGLNLQFYNPSQVEFVWGLEPSLGMRHRAEQRVREAPFEIRWLDLPGEEIPLEDESADTIVVTYTLCSIPDVNAALMQMRRVLRPGGKLLFVEHGLAPDPKVQTWQHRINPTWKVIAGGCHLNRDMPSLLRHAGFALQELETMYLPGTPKFAGFEYWGVATKSS